MECPTLAISKWANSQHWKFHRCIKKFTRKHKIYNRRKRPDNEKKCVNTKKLTLMHKTFYHTDLTARKKSLRRRQWEKCCWHIETEEKSECANVKVEKIDAKIPDATASWKNGWRHWREEKKEPRTSSNGCRLALGIEMIVDILKYLPATLVLSKNYQWITMAIALIYCSPL